MSCHSYDETRSSRASVIFTLINVLVGSVYVLTVLDAWLINPCFETQGGTGAIGVCGLCMFTMGVLINGSIVSGLHFATSATTMIYSILVIQAGPSGTPSPMHGLRT